MPVYTGFPFTRAEHPFGMTVPSTHTTDIATILDTVNTIAIVGCSDKPERPSFIVASYLAAHGYTVIPVNPNITEAIGFRAYPSLSAIPEHIHVDCVDIFRRSEDAFFVVKEALMRGDATVIWMQEGVMNDEAAATARLAGKTVVMDRCMMKEHAKRQR